MRRLTWMRYNHAIKNMFLGSWLRQPMQRTEYYMPWGVVTVDELHKMDVDGVTRVFTFDEIQREWNQIR